MLMNFDTLVADSFLGGGRCKLAGLREWNLRFFFGVVLGELSFEGKLKGCGKVSMLNNTVMWDNNGKNLKITV